MTSTSMHKKDPRSSASIRGSFPPLGDLGGLAVQKHFSKAEWKVWWKRGGKNSPVSRDKNCRKSWRVLTSDLGLVEAFFHREKFAVENLEKQDAATKSPSRYKKQKFFPPVDLGICPSTY